MVYRKLDGKIEVLLVHPGGPFWAKKDEGAWSLPKGEYEDGDDPLEAARREFEEEIGQPAPAGDYFELGEMERNGKTVRVWATEGDMDVSTIKSNSIFIDWPPRSGRKMEIPEVDRAQWFDISIAPSKLHKGQDIFIERLAEHLGLESTPATPAQSSLF